MCLQPAQNPAQLAPAQGLAQKTSQSARSASRSSLGSTGGGWARSHSPAWACNPPVLARLGQRPSKRYSPSAPAHSCLALPGLKLACQLPTAPSRPSRSDGWARFSSDQNPWSALPGTLNLISFPPTSLPVATHCDPAASGETPVRRPARLCAVVARPPRPFPFFLSRFDSRVGGRAAGSAAAPPVWPRYAWLATVLFFPYALPGPKWHATRSIVVAGGVDTAAVGPLAGARVRPRVSAPPSGGFAVVLKPGLMGGKGHRSLIHSVHSFWILSLGLGFLLLLLRIEIKFLFFRLIQDRIVLSFL